MDVLLVCVICTMCVLGVHGSQKKASDPLALGLQEVVSCLMCAFQPNSVLYKTNTTCS